MKGLVGLSVMGEKFFFKADLFFELCQKTD